MKKVAHQFFEDDGLDYEDMLNNFDDFCDQFEKRASESYNGGDPNNGRVIKEIERIGGDTPMACLLYTSPSPRDMSASRMPSSA